MQGNRLLIPLLLLDLLQRRGELGFLVVVLLLLGLQELRVAGLLVVDAALGLGLAAPAAGALVLGGVDGAGGVPVADGLVAAVEEGVVGDVVLVDVRLDAGEGPVDQRVDLDDAAALLVHLDEGDLVALPALRPPPPRQHCRHAEVRVRPLLRLHLGDPVVQLRRRLVQPRPVPLLELRRAGRAVRAVRVDPVVRVLGLDAVD